MKTLISIPLTIALILLIGSFAQAQDEGLIMYLSFDEGAGNTAKDSSGNGNDGVLEKGLDGNGVEWVDGADGKGLSFNGSDGFVEVAYDDMFNLTTGFTLAAWVKPAMAPFAGEQWRGIINGQMSTHGPYLLQMSAANGEIGAWLNGAWQWQVSSAVLDTDNFWHLIGTYDEKEGLRLYVNGELDAENASIGAVQDNVNEGVVIGHNYNFANRWFEGIIDEAVIYNRAIDEDEAMDLYEGVIKERVVAVESVGKMTTTWGHLKGEM